MGGITEQKWSKAVDKVLAGLKDASTGELAHFLHSFTDRVSFLTLSWDPLRVCPSISLTDKYWNVNGASRQVWWRPIAS